MDDSRIDERVMSEAQTLATKRPGRWRKVLLVLIGTLVFVIVGARVWYRYEYPYGYSHACSKGLGMSLRLYAEDHYGWLPRGAATPEASLALLAKDDMTSALWVLGGKNIPHDVVQESLTREGLFGPTNCGWHYIEGLRVDDDPEIAVAWDKVTGLGHNGERQPRCMHEVVLLDGSTQFILKTAWPEFVADQKQRLTRVMASRDAKAPAIRWSDELTLGPNIVQGKR
jgi:hypothetical protein